MISVFQCALYESGLRDVITINVDLSGNVLGASITTGSAVCVGKSVSRNDMEKFKTNVEIVQTVPGPAWVYTGSLIIVSVWIIILYNQLIYVSNLFYFC